MFFSLQKYLKYPTFKKTLILSSVRLIKRVTYIICLTVMINLFILPKSITYIELQAGKKSAIIPKHCDL